MKEWHKVILLYLAGRKTPATPQNIKQYLIKHGISKSHTAITTACKGSLSAILIRHDHSTYNDDGTVKLKRFKYSLNPDPDTLTKLLNTFIGNEYAEEFLKSAYIEMIDNQDLKHIGLEFVVEQVNAALFVATAFVPEADIRWLLNAIVSVRSEVMHDNEAHPRYLDDPAIRHRSLCRRLIAAFRSEYLRDP